MRTNQRQPHTIRRRSRYAKALSVSPAPKISLWDPVPIGKNDLKKVVTISLVQRNFLIGGIPGAGKSAAMSMLLAATALDYETEMYLIDGKKIEFAVWEDCAAGYAHTILDAIEMLKVVERRMMDRLDALYDAWKTEPHKAVRAIYKGQYPLVVIFVDELALFTNDQDAKLSKEFTRLLTNIVALGRAPGFITCAATQKPDATVVSTHLRDLFAYRLALCCSTPEASDTILGRGWAAQGYNAQDIAPGLPGLGYLYAEGGIPQRIRGYHLDDDDVRAYAAWAKDLRRS